MYLVVSAQRNRLVFVCVSLYVTRFWKNLAYHVKLKLELLLILNGTQDVMNADMNSFDKALSLRKPIFHCSIIDVGESVYSRQLSILWTFEQLQEEVMLAVTDMDGMIELSETRVNASVVTGYLAS